MIVAFAPPPPSFLSSPLFFFLSARFLLERTHSPTHSLTHSRLCPGPPPSFPPPPPPHLPFVRPSPRNSAGWNAAAETDEKFEVEVQKAYERGLDETRKQHSGDMVRVLDNSTAPFPAPPPRPPFSARFFLYVPFMLLSDMSVQEVVMMFYLTRSPLPLALCATLTLPFATTMTDAHRLLTHLHLHAHTHTHTHTLTHTHTCTCTHTHTHTHRRL